MDNSLYLEDFTPGQRFRSREHTMDKASIVAFAKEFDPQPQHIDEEGAKKAMLGELVASGWHTAAVTMKLKAETDLTRIAGGLWGLGLDKVRWPRAVRPGDRVHIVVTILDTRPSQSKPDKGILRYKVETFNQDEALVMEMETAVIAPRRPAA